MLAWASARKPFVEYLWRTSDEVQRQLYGTPCFCLYRRISVPARDRVRLREVYCNTQSSQFLASSSALTFSSRTFFTWTNHAPSCIYPVRAVARYRQHGTDKRAECCTSS